MLGAKIYCSSIAQISQNWAEDNHSGENLKLHSINRIGVINFHHDNIY